MQSLYGAIANTNKKEIMAVSINNVYQKVLALANKEQRGYITPQEFNLFADHAQMEIFEQYFYDLNQLQRLPAQNHEYSDLVDIIKDKISLFEYWHRGSANITVINQYGDCVVLKDDVPNLYRLGEVAVSYNIQGIIYSDKTCEQLTPKEFALRTQSKLAKYSYERPVFVKYSSSSYPSRIKIYPYPKTFGGAQDALGNDYADGTDITWSGGTKKAGVNADYIKKPLKPSWGYVVVNNKPLYDPSKSTNFELHASEETELVYKILTLAGVTIEKPQLTQIAAGLQGAQVQQEKQ